MPHKSRNSRKTKWSPLDLGKPVITAPKPPPPDPLTVDIFIEGERSPYGFTFTVAFTSLNDLLVVVPNLRGYLSTDRTRIAIPTSAATYLGVYSAFSYLNIHDNPQLESFGPLAAKHFNTALLTYQAFCFLGLRTNPLVDELGRDLEIRIPSEIDLSGSGQRELHLSDTLSLHECKFIWSMRRLPYTSRFLAPPLHLHRKLGPRVHALRHLLGPFDHG